MPPSGIEMQRDAKAMLTASRCRWEISDTKAKMLWEGMTLDPKPEVNTVVCSLGKPELFMSYIWHVTTFAWLTFSCMSSQGAQWKLRFKGGFNSQDCDVS